jgi:hypothetical protein
MHTQNGNLLKVYLVKIQAYIRWFCIVLTSVPKSPPADPTTLPLGIDVIIVGIN